MSVGENDDEPMDTEEDDYDNVQTIPKLFEEYATELLHEYDLYENLVKKGRDITYESKKIIFALHRVENKEEGEKSLCQAKERLKKLFLQITEDIGSLLKGEEIFKFKRAFRPGLEEFVEAASFYYYLMFGSIVSLSEMHGGTFILGEPKSEDQSRKKGLPMSDILTLSDYILGVLDLTGELMRKCICTKNLEEPFLLRDVLNGIALALMNVKLSHDLKRKYFTLNESLLKVEKVCCSIKVRSAEMEKVMATRNTPSKFKDYQLKMIEDAFTSEPQSSYSHNE